MLALPIKQKWFEMIKSGEKVEEYREITPYYTKRFRTIGLLDEEGKPTRRLAPVVLRNGYRKNAPKIMCWFWLRIGEGKPEWGAEPGMEYYILFRKFPENEKLRRTIIKHMFM